MLFIGFVIVRGRAGDRGPRRDVGRGDPAAPHHGGRCGGSAGTTRPSRQSKRLSRAVRMERGTACSRPIRRSSRPAASCGATTAAPTAGSPLHGGPAPFSRSLGRWVATPVTFLRSGLQAWVGVADRRLRKGGDPAPAQLQGGILVDPLASAVHVCPRLYGRCRPLGRLWQSGRILASVPALICR